uniref:Uncharacterized protein n=1 Tax=Eutreptiella gymnastica TaxID=73025 RepID=A0A7S1N4X1_9EUGL
MVLKPPNPHSIVKIGCNNYFVVHTDWFPPFHARNDAHLCIICCAQSVCAKYEPWCDMELANQSCFSGVWPTCGCVVMDLFLLFRLHFFDVKFSSTFSMIDHTKESGVESPAHRSKTNRRSDGTLPPPAN